MNHVRFGARIAEVAALRYTPAGLPAIDLQLQHESERIEAGVKRQVKATLKAVAFGAMAETLARQPIGSEWRFDGFLAAPRGGKHPVLHIDSIEPVQPPNPDSARGP